MHLGEKLTLLLQKHRLNQSDLGREIGRVMGGKQPTAQAISAWVRKGQLDRMWLLPLVKIFGIRLEWLIDDDAPMSAMYPVEVVELSTQVAQEAAIKAFRAAHAVGIMDEPQFLQLFVLFCGTSAESKPNPSHSGQNIQGNGNIQISHQPGKSNQ